MRTVDFLKRYVLYHLLMVLLFVAGYWLLTGFAPKSSLHTLIQYAVGPLVLVIYTLLSYRFLATVPATAGALKRLYVITGVPLLMGSFILYSIAGYYTDPDPGIIDGEAVIRAYGIPTIDETRALALVRDFNAAFGYCSDASPKLRQFYGCRVTIGNEYKTHAEYTIDPKREAIRSFRMVYDRQAAAPLPAAPVSSDLTEVARRIHQQLALPVAAVQGDQADVAGIQNDLNPLFSNQGRDQGQEASRRFVWQKEYQGIPYFFNQIVMGFDPAHRLTYYYNDWTEDTPTAMEITITPEQADAAGREYIEKTYDSGYLARTEFRNLGIRQYIIQPVLGGSLLECRKGAYRLGWVVEYQVYFRGDPRDREYHLIDGRTGEHLGHMVAPARFVLPEA